jgi:serine/threonine protein kinase
LAKVASSLQAGSTGNIYKARLKGTNEICALKCINIQDMYRQNTVERLHTEIRVLSMFRGSRFVVNLHDFFEDDTYVYLVLEYIDGVACDFNRYPYRNC